MTKEYTEPRQDYFDYGQLVDTLLTEPEKLDERFIKVSRRAKEGDSMALVGEMQALEGEIQALEVEIAKKPNKTKEKGLATRRTKLAELRQDVKDSRVKSDRAQITPSIWDNAHETAETIKRNPLWQEIADARDKGEAIFQLAIESEDFALKGTLDVLLAPAEVITAIRAWRGRMGTIESVRDVAEVAVGAPGARLITVIDIKTVFQLAKCDPAQYAKQLVCYEDLIEWLTSIRPRSMVLAGDKDPDLKTAQDFAYDESVLIQARQTIQTVKTAFHVSVEAWDKGMNILEAFPAAKTFRGREQECFRCSVCRERPYSDGKPYLVTL